MSDAPVYTVTINGVEFLTRAWYMNSPEYQENGYQKHRMYYRQFVNQFVRATVARHFRIPRLALAFNAGDVSFNECTSLRQWDALYKNAGINGTALGICNYPQHLGDKPYVSYSLSDNTCILKEAARILCEEYLESIEQGEDNVLRTILS